MEVFERIPNLSPRATHPLGSKSHIPYKALVARLLSPSPGSDLAPAPANT